MSRVNCEWVFCSSPPLCYRTRSLTSLNRWAANCIHLVNSNDDDGRLWASFQVHQALVQYIITAGSGVIMPDAVLPPETLPLSQPQDSHHPNHDAAERGFARPVQRMQSALEMRNGPVHRHPSTTDVGNDEGSEELEAILTPASSNDFKQKESQGMIKMAKTD